MSTSTQCTCVRARYRYFGCECTTVRLEKCNSQGPHQAKPPIQNKSFLTEPCKKTHLKQQATSDLQKENTKVYTLKSPLRRAPTNPLRSEDDQVKKANKQNGSESASAASRPKAAGKQRTTTSTSSSASTGGTGDDAKGTKIYPHKLI